MSDHYSMDLAAETASEPVMDFPAAWAFVKATDPADHDPRCSWRTQNGALLCDCDVLWDEYVRRGGKDPRAEATDE